jgi:hypothetical protein
MLLQGNLQVVFDALYHLGVIDPVLKMDWSKAMEDLREHPQELKKVVKIANHYQEDWGILKAKLEGFDNRTLSFLAMEVARELASFHTRNTLH